MKMAIKRMVPKGGIKPAQSRLKVGDKQAGNHRLKPVAEKDAGSSRQE